MRLFHISLHNHACEDKLLLHADTLGFLSFWNRSKITSILDFISIIISSKCKLGEKVSIEDGEFVVHVYINSANVAVIVISDSEYPKEVAHRLIDKLLKEDSIDVDILLKILTDCQDPNFDPIYKVKKELEETKDIICKSLEKLLERGEKLDDLIQKTQYLSENSKSFYKASKKMNRWCPLWFPFF